MDQKNNVFFLGKQDQKNNVSTCLCLLKMVQYYKSWHKKEHLDLKSGKETNRKKHVSKYSTSVCGLIVVRLEY